MTSTVDVAALNKQLQGLSAEEEELQFIQFSNDDAFLLGTAFIAAARKGNLAITVDIQKHGQQLFHFAMKGTTADNDAWVSRKARLVARFQHSSLFMHYRYAILNTNMVERHALNPAEFSSSGGGFPLTIAGTGCVGTIAVSGLPHIQDHQFLVRVLRQFLSEKNASSKL